MSTKFLNPKATVLLGAGLNVLHFESQEWLHTIAFWKDEIKFFDHLLKKVPIGEDGENDLKKILQELDEIHRQNFNYMENDIVAHEKFLSRLVKGEKGLSDAQYREKHRELFERMDTFKTEFFKFKNLIFKCAKNKNFSI